MSQSFQFSVRALMAAIAGIATILGVAVSHPPETVIVAALLSIGGAVLLLSDVFRARFRRKHSTLEICSEAYERARKRARIALWTVPIWVVLGVCIIALGYNVGWPLLIVVILLAGACRGLFDYANAIMQRYIEIALGLKPA